MSLALEVWRLLEAWDPAKHPRGPNGRFIKLGGGHDRPSLADVVKGTAAAGPKRATAGRSMSVADAVRAAARRSDSTGRPTQRPTAEHRAHGAHDVADEVDRALAEAGVSEEQRAKVSARVRAAADAHGPRPETLRATQRPAPASLDIQTSGDDIEARQAKAAAAIRARKAAASASSPAVDPKVDAAAGDIRSYVEEQLHNDRRTHIYVSAVRDHLGDRYPREVVDKALTNLALAHGDAGMSIIPVANVKSLKPHDRAAAIKIGGEESHIIGPRPRGQEVNPERSAALAPEVPGGYSREQLDTAPDRWLRNNLELERESNPSSPKIAQLEAEIARRGGGDSAPQARPAQAPMGGARNAVVDAYASLQRFPGDWVPLAELRDKVPSSHSRAEVDAALEELAMRPGVQLIPWDNRKALTARDHDAALHFGGEENNNLRIESPDEHRTPAAPSPGGNSAQRQQLDAARAAHADTVRRLADALRATTSRDAARAAIADLKVRELRALAEHVGMSPGSKATKARLIDSIVEATAGRRLDSQALSRL